MPPTRRSTSGRSPATGSSRRRVAVGRYRIPAAWFVVLGLMAVLGLVLLVAARPTWRAFKRIQGDRFARQAETFLAQNQWSLALDRTRSALQLSPANTRALRCAAHLYGRIGIDAALPYYDALLAAPDATRLDREDYAALALRLGNTNLAGIQIRFLLETTQPTPRTKVIAAQFQAATGNTPLALALAREALAAEPANPTNAFTLATLLASSRRVTDHEEALRQLWPFALTNGAFQLRALAAILSAPDSPRTQRERVASVLEAKSPRTFDEGILWYEARANLDPSLARSLAEEMIRTLQPRSERELRLMVEWLIIRDFVPEAFGLLQGERSLRDRPLFLIHHRALMATGERQRGYDLLFHPAAPFSQFELEAFRCQAAVALGDAKLRDTHLQNAARLAESSLQRAALVTQLADLCGDPAPAAGVWRRLLRNPRTAGLALRQLAVLADLQGDLLSAREYARQLAALEPANPAPRLAIAHADLLLGENLDAALAEARQLSDSDPLSPDLRALVALGYLRKGEPRLAHDALQGTILRYETSSPGLLAIIAATFAANDMIPEAQKFFDRIPIASLKSEERELLRPLIALESRLVNGLAPR